MCNKHHSQFDKVVVYRSDVVIYIDDTPVYLLTSLLPSTNTWVEHTSVICGLTGCSDTPAFSLSKVSISVNKGRFLHFVLLYFVSNYVSCK